MDTIAYARKANALYLRVFLATRRRRILSPLRRQELEALTVKLGLIINNEIERWTA